MEKMRNYLSLPHSLNLKNFSFFQFFNFKNFSLSHSLNFSISRISHSFILSIFQLFCASLSLILVSTCLVL